MLCRTLLVMAFSAALPSVAFAADEAPSEVAGPSYSALSSGVVRAVNRSDREVTLRATSVVTADGSVRALRASWRIRPGASTFLVVGDERLRVHRMDAVLETPTGSMPWMWDRPENGVLTLEFGDDALTPPSAWVGTVGGEDDSASTLQFATPDAHQTIVLAGANLSGGAAIAVEVLDLNGRVVSRSAQDTGVARCMLTTRARGVYSMRVRSIDGNAANYRLQLTTISHVDVLAKAAAEETVKAALVGLLVSYAGNENDRRQYKEALLSGAWRDAAGVAVLDGLLELQRSAPWTDPWRLAESLQASIHGDRDRFFDVTRAVVEELNARVRKAVSL